MLFTYWFGYTSVSCISKQAKYLKYVKYIFHVHIILSDLTVYKKKCPKQKILQHIIQFLLTLHFRGGQQAATIRVLRHARVVIRWPEVDQLAAESLISLPAHCQSTLWEHTRPPSYLYKLISLSRPYGMQGIFLMWEILKSHTSSSN